MPMLVMCLWHFLSLGVVGFGAGRRKAPKDILVMIYERKKFGNTRELDCWRITPAVNAWFRLLWAWSLVLHYFPWCAHSIRPWSPDLRQYNRL